MVLDNLKDMVSISILVNSNIMSAIFFLFLTYSHDSHTFSFLNDDMLLSSWKTSSSIPINPITASENKPGLCVFINQEKIEMVEKHSTIY